MENKPLNRDDSERGFTVLEALVALVIVAGALAGVFRTVDTAMRSGRQARFQSQSAIDARSLLSRVGSLQALSDGVSRGTFPSGSSWELTIAPLPARAGSKLRGFAVSLRIQSSPPSPQSAEFRTVQLASAP